MKLIEQSVEQIIQAPGIEGAYEIIEKAARLCYASEPNETTREQFVDRLKKNKHLAMFEHATIYLYFSLNPYHVDDNNFIHKYDKDEYSKVVCCGTDDNNMSEDGNFYNLIGKPSLRNVEYCITTNLRSVIEHGWKGDLQYICKPTKHHIKRHTFLINTSIGISREIMRHRKYFSYAQQSTRYCNYSKTNKMDEMTFVRPKWCELPIGYYNFASSENNYIIDNELYNTSELERIYTRNNISFMEKLLNTEKEYNLFVNNGLKPQQAREILPLCLNAPMIVTADENSWKHFMDLRLHGTTGSPHPDMKILAKKINEYLKLQ